MTDVCSNGVGTGLILEYNLSNHTVINHQKYQITFKQGKDFYKICEVVKSGITYSNVPFVITPGASFEPSKLQSPYATTYYPCENVIFSTYSAIPLLPYCYEDTEIIN